MKIGDMILCTSEADRDRTERALEIGGFQSIRVNYHGMYLRITATPDTEYLVQAADQNGRTQKVYCETFDESCEVMLELSTAYEYVEILEGYPGEYQQIAKTW